jgi:hypothetical protein
MNKYEKYVSRGKGDWLAGWDRPVCQDCALARLKTIGACDHLEHITGGYFATVRKLWHVPGFNSPDGTSLTCQETDGLLACGH